MQRAAPESFGRSGKKRAYIPEAEFVRLKNHTLRDEQLNALFNHRPAKDKTDYQSLIAAGELTGNRPRQMIVSLLRPERLLDMTPPVYLILIKSWQDCGSIPAGVWYKSTY